MECKKGDRKVNGTENASPIKNFRTSEISNIVNGVESNENGFDEQVDIVKDDMKHLTDTELEIAQVWADILAIPMNTIGVHDTLFGLGGNSVMIGEFMSRGFAFLNLSLLFENLSLEKLAKVVENFRDSIELEEGLIPNVPNKTTFPLSFEQANMWKDILQILHDQPALNVHIAIYFDQNFDEIALKKSAEYVVRRHELLRSIIIFENGDPMAPVWKYLEFPPIDFQVIDLTDDDFQEAKRKMLEFETNELKKSVDLQAYPLIYFVAFKLQGGGGCLKIFTHHIIMDGVSVVLFRKEMMESYQAFSSNLEAPNLQNLTIQYGDYSIWQKNRFETNTRFIKNLQSYWARKLENCKPLILPSDREPPPSNIHIGRFYTFSFSPKLSAQIDAFSQAQGTIPFVTLFTSLQVLFYHLTGQTDITTASISKGRSNIATRNLIGHFMNFIVLRNDLSGNPEFEDFLQSVHDELVSTLEHQDYPFSSLLEHVPSEELKRNIFGTIVQMLPPVEGDDNNADIFKHVEVQENYMPTPIADEFVLLFAAVGNEYRVNINYHVERFDLSTIESIGQKLKCLLENGIENPAKRIDELK